MVGGLLVSIFIMNLAIGDWQDTIEVEWEKTYGEGDWAYDVEQTSDGGYIVAGVSYTKDAHPETCNAWLIKTDENGNEIWNKTYGGNMADVGFETRNDHFEGYVVIGYKYEGTKDKSNDDPNQTYSRLSHLPNASVYMIKIDEYGNELCNLTFGVEKLNKGYSIALTDENTDHPGYIIAGRTISSDFYEQAYLIKLKIIPVFP